MNNTIHITLAPLKADDKEQFIKDNQAAFLYGATEEFGMRDNHFEEEGQTISRKTIERSIERKNAETYRIMMDEQKVGGVVLQVERDQGELDILFVAPKIHSKGVGYAAWCAVEQMHPEVRVWSTHTPYFEKRNIHFYVNRCGFHIVEFYNRYHRNFHSVYTGDNDNAGQDLFRFEKVMR